VKITGAYPIPCPSERAYSLLQDPVILAACMPGCEMLERTGDGEYRMKMRMTLASVCGLFDGKVRIADSQPSERFRLVVEGTGKIGFMKGDGLLSLAPDGAGVSVQYDGEVQVGGTIAAVGQRLIDTTAHMLIKRFFEKLTKHAAAIPASTVAAQ